MIYEINHVLTADVIWQWRNDRQAAEFLCDAVLVFATPPPSYNVCSMSRHCRALFLLVSVKTLSNLAGFRGAPSSSVDGYLLTGPYWKWKILLKGLICYQITFFLSCCFHSCCASIFWKAKEKSVIMNGVSFWLAEWAWTTHIPTLLRGYRRGPGTSYAGWMTYLRKLHSSFPFTTAVP